MWAKLAAITKSKVYKMVFYSFLAVVLVFGGFILSGAFKQEDVYASSLQLDAAGIYLGSNGEYYLTIYNDTAITVNSIPSNVTNKRVDFNYTSGDISLTETTVIGSSAVVSLMKDSNGVPVSTSVSYARVTASCGTAFAVCNIVIDAEINEIRDFVTKTGVEQQKQSSMSGQAYEFHWSQVYNMSDVKIESEAYSNGTLQTTAGVGLMTKLTRFAYHREHESSAEASHWNINTTTGQLSFNLNAPSTVRTYKFSITQQVKYEGSIKTNMTDVEKTIVHYFYITVTY